MLNCYKCDILFDNGVTYRKYTLVVFATDAADCVLICNKKLCLHHDEEIKDITVERIEPSNGLVIEIK